MKQYQAGIILAVQDRSGDTEKDEHYKDTILTLAAQLQKLEQLIKQEQPKYEKEFEEEGVPDCIDCEDFPDWFARKELYKFCEELKGIII